MLIFVVAASILTVAYAQDAAVVYLFDPSGKSGVTGNVTFAKASNGIEITGEIHGLTEGKHGFHIHKLGHIAPGCLGTGGHFNPHNKNHGAPEDKIRHVGDLGNIEADSSGVAHIKILDKVVALDGENCIIGRAVVVHEKEDDLGKGTNPDSLVTGNAGGRVACGVIGIQSESAAVGIYSSTTLLAASIISISFYKYVK